MKMITVTEISSIPHVINIDHIVSIVRAGDDYKSEITLSNNKKIIVNLSIHAIQNLIDNA